MYLKITAIIPTFNRIQFLNRSINSIINQTYPVDQIILVDNLSTDNTKKYINSKYKQIKVLNQKNRGVSHSRNLGIENSSNDWIAFLDSDDAWMPNKIEKQVKLLKKSNNLLKFIHTNEVWMKNGKIQCQKKKHFKEGGNIFKNCLDICKISPSSVLMHRSLFDKFGLFDTKFKVCEDYELWLRLTSKIEIGYIKENLLTKYGGHSDQLSKKYWGIDRYRIKALEKFILKFAVKNEYKQEAFNFLMKKINIVILGAINRKNMRILKMYSFKKFLWSEYYHNEQQN